MKLKSQKHEQIQLSLKTLQNPSIKTNCQLLISKDI